MHNTWMQAALELRQKGYNHTAGDNYARVNGKRLDRAHIIRNPDGTFSVKES